MADANVDSVQQAQDAQTLDNLTSLQQADSGTTAPTGGTTADATVTTSNPAAPDTPSLYNETVGTNNNQTDLNAKGTESLLDTATFTNDGRAGTANESPTIGSGIAFGADANAGESQVQYTVTNENPIIQGAGTNSTQGAAAETQTNATTEAVTSTASTTTTTDTPTTNSTPEPIVNPDGTPVTGPTADPLIVEQAPQEPKAPNATNNPPVDGNESKTVTEDTPLTVDAAGGLLANANDIDGGTLTVTGYTIPGIDGAQTVGSPVTITGVGSITINSDGSYSFTPAANYTGAIPVITYTISDGNGGTDTSTLTLTMSAVNDPPVDGNESKTVTEDTPLTVDAAGGLLANANDIDGGTLTVTGYTIPGIDGAQTVGSPVTITGVGSITINSDGSYSFTPAANYTGAIPVITYTISDGNGGTDTSTLTLTMSAVNDPPVDGNESKTVTEDTPLTVDAAGGLLANANDIDGGTLTVTGYTIPGIDGAQTVGSPVTITGVGSITINSDGSYSFTPAANYTGAIPVITYTISDGNGGTDTSTLTLTMSAVNDPPVDGNESKTVTEDTPLTVDAAGGLLANANDIDGGTLTVTGYTIPGIDGAQTVGSPVTITGVGSITINSDGSYSFTPAANYTGAIPVITYTISDGNGGTDTSTLTLTMSAVNDPPVDGNESKTVTEDTTLTVNAAGGLLANATDVDGGALTVTGYTIPGITGTQAIGTPVAIDGVGSITINSDGSYSFTPAANYTGAIPVITYTISDGNGGTDTSTLTLTMSAVNDPPVDGNESKTVTEDTPLTVDAAGGLLANANDIDGGTLTVTGYTIPGIDGAQTVGSPVTITGVGSITINSDGSYSFTPAANYTGAIPVITYTISDGNGGTDTSTLTLTMSAVNDPPVDGNESKTVTEDTPLTVDAAGGLLANANDIDGGTLTVTGYTIPGIDGAQTVGSPVTITGVGSITINSDGSYSFTPAANYTGAIPVITYTISDGNGGTDTSTLTLTMSAVNDPPVDGNESKTVTEDTPLTVDAAGGLLANANDIDGGTLTVTGYTIPGIDGAQTVGSPVTITGVGSITINSDGSYSFTPAANYTGAIPVITYTISDGNGGTDTSTLTLTMSAVNVTLQVDETYPALDATADFASAFNAVLTVTPGADGVGVTTSTYSFSGFTNGVDSGVNTTAGEDVLLYRVDSTHIEGRISGTSTVAFTLTVSNSGVVTLDQQVSLHHDTAGNANEPLGLSLAAGTITLSRTDSVTDGDGDPASNTANLNITSAISFLDDGPSIATGTVSSNATLQVDETYPALDATADFASAFNAVLTVTPGADGVGVTTSTYSFSGFTNGVDSGVNTTAGEDVLLYRVDSTHIEGRISGTSTVAFTLTVSNSGVVTLDQQVSLHHDTAGNANEPLGLSLAAGTITLSRTDSVTDGDGDPASNTANLNITSAISFLDDGPSIATGTVSSNATLQVDETYPALDATADFASAFNAVLTVTPGADGVGVTTSTYSFSGFTNGVDSGVNTTAGEDVLLYRVDSTHIEGRISGTSTVAFTLTVSNSGVVTLDQQVSLHHDTAGNANEPLGLSLAAGTITLSRTDSVTDGDGDPASNTANLNITSAISFLDDGPSIATGTVSSNATLQVDETYPALDATADFASAFNAVLTVTPGADGVGVTTSTYSFSGFTNGVDSGVNTTAGEDVLLYRVDSTHIEGRISGTSTVAFTLTVSNSGVVTLDQQVSLHHDTAGNANEPLGLSLAAGTITLSRTDSVTDGDGDPASNTANLNITSAISFLDDGPSIATGTVSSNATLQVDETYPALDATADFASAFNAVLTVTPGADGVGVTTSTYSFSGFTNGVDSGVNTTAGEDVLLYRVDSTHIEGRISGTSTVAFTLTVSNSGVVTLDQQVSLHHDTAGNANEPLGLSLAAGTITLSRTDSVTDGDGDPASNTANLNITSAISFLDDGPSIATGTVSSNATLQVDETYPALDATADFASAFNAVLTVTPGADGVGVTTSTYSFSGFTNGVDSGVNTTAGEDVLLYRVDSTHIEGRISGTSTVAFTLTVSNSGVVTLDQQVSLHHDTAGNANEPLGLSLAAGTITLSRTDSVTDGDGDPASNTANLNITSAISFLDDGPSIATGTVSSNATLQVDETYPALDATADFASAFNAVLTVTPGADGVGVTTSTYSFSGFTNGVDSGVNTTAGEDVLLYRVDSTHIEGRISGTSTVAFTLTVSNSGVVTLDQQVSLHHDTAGNANEPLGLSLAAGTITLSRTDSVTDGDGDPASNTANLNITSAISFLDDGPQVAITSALSTNAAVVDESGLTGTRTISLGSITQGVDPDVTGTGYIGSATTSSAVVTLSTENYGADGANASNSKVYALSVANATSGLTLTDGTVINLVQVNPGVVVGQVASGALINQAAFAIAIDAATGVVRVEQYLSLAHPTGGTSYNESTAITANALKATVTLKDGDGDIVSSSAVDISNQISFLDDGPSVTVSGVTPGAASLQVDESSLGTVATTNFATSFSASTSSGGADGTASLTSVYTLGVKTVGVDSGLVDNATGNRIYLYQSGSSVVGRVGSAATTADASGTVAFTVSNSGSYVTLNQVRAIKHGDTSNVNEPATLTTANLVTLTRTDTIVDKDGDSATSNAVINLGNAISFLDDGPQVAITSALSTNAAVVDESGLTGTRTISLGSITQGVDPDVTGTGYIGSATTSSAVVTLSTENYGADGANASNSKVYALSVANATSGLTLTDGTVINLVQVNPGVVVGQVASGALINQAAFAIAIDAATGVVRVEQYLSLAHPTGGTSYNESTAITANALKATVTLKDGDGDIVSSSAVDISNQISFLDDGPSVTVSGVTPGAASLQVDESSLGTVATTNFATSFSASTSSGGADGTASLTSVYTLGVKTVGVDSGLVDNATGNRIYLYQSGSSVVGRVGSAATTADASGTVAFTVSNSGSYVTLNQVRAIKHGDTSNVNEPATLTTANLVTLTRTDTIVDKDGDSATSNAVINLGNAISFLDDGPQVAITSALSTNAAVVDESGLTGTRTISLGSITQGVDPDVTGTGYIGSATTSSAVVTLSTENYGADGANASNSKVYALSVANATSGLTLTDGTVINLVQVNPGVVVGQVASGALINQAAFAIAIDAATGVVRVEQYLSLAHPTGGTSYNESTAITANALKATVTLKDGDGDIVSSSAVDISNQISFLDDGPSVTVSGVTPGAASLQVDESSLGTVATTNFATSFSASTSSGGADGTASLTSVYTLGVKTVGVDSGLVDNATGNRIYLYQSGSSVVGRVGSAATTADASGTVAFTVSNSGSYVTLNQVRAIKHGDTSNVNEPATLTTANLVTLTRTDTIVDKDGDSATSNAVINLGNAISFLDDGPQVAITSALSTNAAVVDESGLTGTRTISLGSITQGVDPDVTGTGYIGSATTSSAVVTLSTENYGADGANASNSKVYALSVANATSGLTLTDGTVINLVQVNPGVVVGQVASGALINQAAFAIAIDAATGVVRVEQYLSLAHPTGGTSYNESTAITANALKATVTLKDGDGDIVSSSAVDISNQISFLDDGPSVTVSGVTPGAASLQVDESSLGTVATTNFATSFSASTSSGGADGTASLTSVYTLGVKTVGVDSGLVDNATGNRIYLYQSGSSVVGRVGSAATTADASGTVAFTVSNSGSYVTLNQVRAIKHGDTSNVNEPATLTTANLVTLTRTDTIVDKDGDSATSNAVINLGNAISFLDDGPMIDISNITKEMTKANVYSGTWIPSIGSDLVTEVDTIEHLIQSIIVNAINVNGASAVSYTPLVRSTNLNDGVVIYDGQFKYDTTPKIVGGNADVNYRLTFSPDGSGGYKYTIALDKAIQTFDIQASEYSSSVKASGPVPIYNLTYTDSVSGDIATATVTSMINGVSPAPPNQIIYGSGSSGTIAVSYTGSDINVSTDGIGVDNNVLESYITRDNTTKLINYSVESILYNPTNLANQVTIAIKGTGDVGWTQGDVLLIKVNGFDFSGSSISYSYTLVGQSNIATSNIMYMPPGSTDHTIVKPLNMQYIDSVGITTGFGIDAQGSVSATAVKIAFGFNSTIVSDFVAPVDFAFTGSIKDGDGDITNDEFIVMLTPDTTAPSEPSITSVTDNFGSITGTVADGGRTDDATLGVRVSLVNTGALAGDTVMLYNGSTSSSISSKVTLLQADISAGYVDITTNTLTNATTYNIQAAITDQAGNISALSATGANDVTIDTAAPAAPSITSVTDNVGSITGTVADGGRTDDVVLNVRVNLASTGALAGDTVMLYNGSTDSSISSKVTLLQADISAGYVDVATSTLTNGISYNIQAAVTDQVGNISALSATGANDVTIDTAAPAAPSITSVTDNVGSITGTVADGGRTDDVVLNVRVNLASTGALAGDTVMLYNGSTDSSISSKVTLLQADISAGYVDVATSTLTNGISYNIQAAVTDQVGNISALSATGANDVTIDTSAPLISSTTPSQGTNVSNGQASANFVITFNESISVGTGTITIYQNGTLIESFDVVTSQDNVSTLDNGFLRFGTNNITINPTNSLVADANYEVRISAGAVKDVAGNSNAASNFSFVGPIAIDLNGDGVSYLSRESGITYDYNHDGIAESTAWVAPEDGLLALQKEDGNHSIVFSTQAGETDLQGLAKVYDTNKDGVLDQSDTDFAKFGVWQDADSDGIVDNGEFLSLADRGITSLSLASDGQVHFEANGDVIVYGQTTYTTSDGQLHIAEDVGFAVSDVYEPLDIATIIANADAIESVTRIDQSADTESSSSLMVELGGQTYEIATLAGHEAGTEDILSQFVGSGTSANLLTNKSWTDVIDISSDHGGPGSIIAAGGTLNEGNYANGEGDWTVIINSGDAKVDASNNQITFASESADNSVTIITADGASHDINNVDKIQWHG